MRRELLRLDHAQSGGNLARPGRVQFADQLDTIGKGRVVDRGKSAGLVNTMGISRHEPFDYDGCYL